HVRQPCRLLVYRIAARICAVLPSALGSARHLERTLFGINHHRISAADRLEPPPKTRKSAAIPRSAPLAPWQLSHLAERQQHGLRQAFGHGNITFIKGERNSRENLEQTDH